MRKPATPISTMVITSMRLRPSRSPKWPKTTPPIGLARYPVANVPRLATVAISGSRLEKKTLLNTTAEAVAYRRKS